MNKFIPAITLLTLLSLQAPVEATWGSKRKPQSKDGTTEAQGATSGFNLQDNRSAFIEVDYLFWKPHLENNYFAIKTSSPSLSKTNNPNVPISATSKLKQPSFDLSSGVRVGIGGYNSDSWDVGLRGTYLYSEASKTIHADPAINTISIPDWFGSIFGLDGTKAHNRWQMNFGLLDFSFGREFFLTKRFAAHPFIGLRGAIINQKNHLNYTSNFTLLQTAGPSIIVSHHTKLSAKNNMWGVGPRAGLDLNFYVSKDWSFLGGLAGSLLYMQYHVKEKFFGLNMETNAGVSTLTPTTLLMKDSNNLGRANLDAYFGLGWNHWYNNGKNRVAIALTFEAQQWFGLNQWFNLDLINQDSTNPSPLKVRTDKNTGDLSLIGGTVHFQVDF